MDLSLDSQRLHIFRAFCVFCPVTLPPTVLEGPYFPSPTQPGTTVLFNIRQEVSTKFGYVLSFILDVNIVCLFVSFALLTPLGMSRKNSLFPIWWIKTKVQKEAGSRIQLSCLLIIPISNSDQRSAMCHVPDLWELLCMFHLIFCCSKRCVSKTAHSEVKEAEAHRGRVTREITGSGKAASAESITH